MYRFLVSLKVRSSLFFENRSTVRAPVFALKANREA
jgi:hypothetical protein